MGWLIGRSEGSKRWCTTDRRRREKECWDEEGDREVAGRDGGRKDGRDWMRGGKGR